MFSHTHTHVPSLGACTKKCQIIIIGVIKVGENYGKKKKDILGTYSTLRAFMGRTSEVLTLSKKARESMSVILLRSSLHHAQFLMCA
jgi:hypothetical protein